MPRKPSLSPSKLTTYLACPTKYMWTYVDERGKWYLRSRRHYSFGTSLHNVLQRFHDSADAGVTTIHEAQAALEEGWISAGYSSQEEMTQALAEGKEILAGYIEEVQKAPVTAETVMIEKTLRMDLGDFVLLGRVDRVDRREDGTLEIIDYKSGRRKVGPEDVQGDLAMDVYQLLVRHHHPETPVMATIIALRANSSASARLSDQEAEEVREDLIRLGREVLHRDWSAVEPTAKRLCLDCDFLQLCSKHPEFDQQALARLRAESDLAGRGD
ncbi:MAG: PD-(D/E)XK nuclease family protein [Fimbriimonadaceae bacterium]|nr:PD-(D/E)XK nuclease family protein [Fimbriimonadaceae bacterium]